MTTTNCFSWLCVLGSQPRASVSPCWPHRSEHRRASSTARSPSTSPSPTASCLRCQGQRCQGQRCQGRCQCQRCWPCSRPTKSSQGFPWCSSRGCQPNALPPLPPLHPNSGDLKKIRTAGDHRGCATDVRGGANRNPRATLTTTPTHSQATTGAAVRSTKARGADGLEHPSTPKRHRCLTPDT